MNLPPLISQIQTFADQSFLYIQFKHIMTDVLSPLYSTECRNFTFDFEEFIKSELGLDLDKPKKKEGTSAKPCTRLPFPINPASISPLMLPLSALLSFQMNTFVNTSYEALAIRERRASISIRGEEIERSPWFASTGCVDYVKKVNTANSCMCLI